MRLADVFHRKGSRGATPQEVIAAQHVLTGLDPRFELLIEQLRTTPEVRREHPAPDRLRVEPTSTFEDLNFVLEVPRVQSAWVAVPDARSGRILEFRATVVRSGFLEALEGRTGDEGPWPEEWDVSPPAASPQGPSSLVLPSLEENEAAQRRAQAQLEEWFGVTLRTDITLYAPVPEPVVHTRESELGARFTSQYRRFLSITDGVDGRDIRALSHQDAYLVDDPAFSGVVIAWDSDNTDDFIAVQELDGRDEAIRRIDVHERDRRMRDLAPDLASYLRDRLGSS